MIDDIFNSPTVVIRQRTDGFNRKLAPPPTQACATPDRKAFSDITNLRPMATPEFHKGKTSILPYRGSTPITPGIEHLFLSDLDNTASPQSEQGTINGFSCDMTTDCSANDSVGSPEQCKGSHSQEATPTSDRRTSIYTKIMTEAVFSLPRSPAKTAEDGDDSHRSLADTSERSINAELKRNTLRLTHLDSDSEGGDGDSSANNSYTAQDGQSCTSSPIRSPVQFASSPIKEEHAEERGGGEEEGEEGEEEEEELVSRAKERELLCLRARLEEQEQLTDLLCAHVPAEATLEARALAQTGRSAAGKDWAVMMPIPENGGAARGEEQQRALSLALALELKKAREDEEDMREVVQSAEERAAGLESTLRNAVTRLQHADKADSDRGKRFKLVRNRLEAALSQLEEEGRVKDISMVSASSSISEASPSPCSTNVSPCANNTTDLESSTLEPAEAKLSQSEVWHEHWYRAPDEDSVQAPTGLSPAFSRKAADHSQVRAGAAALFGMEESAEPVAEALAVHPRRRGGKMLLALGWVALAGAVAAWSVAAMVPHKLVGVY